MIKTLDMRAINAAFAKVEQRHAAQRFPAGHELTSAELKEWQDFAIGMIHERKYTPKPTNVNGINYPSRRAARKAGAFQNQKQTV